MAAPCSINNDKGERDPEVHPTKKGKKWHFGMKVHIGVDAEWGWLPMVKTTVANAHGITQAQSVEQKQIQVRLSQDA